MPITYSFDLERGLILARVTGKLDVACIEDYFSRLKADKDCPDNSIEVVDFSGVTDFALQYSEINRIPRTFRSTRKEKNIQATVFHCTSDLSYGIARMLQTLNEISDDRHVAFVTRSREELDRCIEELRSGR